jgi:hypothetical protein
LTPHSAASSNRPRRTSVRARAPSMPNSMGSNGLSWREWSEDEMAARVPGLRVDERQRVVAQGEVRAELDRLLQLEDRLAVAAAQPDCTAHRPVCCGVTVVGQEASPGGLECPVHLRPVPRPAPESVLEVGEGEASVGALEGRGRDTKFSTSTLSRNIAATTWILSDRNSR